MNYDVFGTPIGESIRIGCELSRWIGINLNGAIVKKSENKKKLTLECADYRVTVECRACPGGTCLGKET